ncbi:hypothetical protein I204_01921 [Kwoniella mangroviensis CBS 8886]|uniref:uncharacterized protein n=1 Tax=Kwoniella mangroviensis CBS 8507 TaxID=1296122 RepID=UPI00080D79C4|nr:uncharacterized protein I203_03772 [Kwoniella mangroviensis CBS 8507]OCF67087.1 hypothetical protein I203_03772 [Kwoniella mangroviensis CBS 8507]OCF77918.1 hypothetical protein I204_01921 [Kwoniella mangroviensis CBS 8886]
MNPAAPPPTGAHLAPDASPLHPPSLMHNTRILSSLGTLSACFSGLISGILGFTNLNGFLLYLFSSIFTSFILLVLKCNFDVRRYIPQAHSNTSSADSQSSGSGGGKSIEWKGYWALTGVNQENLLGFLLFWIGSFALIHGELPFYRVNIPPVERAP